MNQYQCKWEGPLILFVCLTWMGCGSTTNQEDPVEVVKRTDLDKLPVAHRELMLAWRNQTPDWPRRREMALDDPSLTRFLVENLMVELLAAWQAGSFTRRGFPELGRYDVIKRELWQIGAPVAEPMAELLAMGNGQGPAIAGDVLQGLGPAGVQAVSKHLLRTDGWSARGRAAELLARLPHGGEFEAEVQERLIELLHSDPEWIVRKHCALALAQRSRGLGGAGAVTPDRALGALSRALVDPDPAVAKAAAVGLGLLGDVRAVPALINDLERILRSTDLSHTRSVYRSLSVLTGMRDLRGTSAWRDWWHLHGKARVDAQRGDS
ncbi:MAG: HEAT repeat domain-containing protein [bacterium]